MALTNADRKQLAYTLGIMDQPGVGVSWPDLKRKLDRLYDDRLAKLPWVPASWLEAVRAIQAKHPADLIIPTPGRDARGARSAAAPSFADDDAKLDAWHTLYDGVRKAVTAYAAGMAAEGEAELASLQASAAFWDGAYNIAKAARDLPAAAVSAVGGGVADFVGSFLPESLKAYSRWIALALGVLIVGGVVLWYRGKLGKLAAGFKAASKAAA